ncbi:site-specific integrase [Pseudonocardia sp. RS11V-5]|uniref:tyrosine-type recombinase/integrase n=1 Tax=Pseudonocardia terrae TaxID=2905831 RepID=UPI001E2D80FD|nr:site-specific integrase [Pseudonocardia terrae]MCE3554523.1 site-specific integrase [Pseudonocardia terrae]
MAKPKGLDTARTRGSIDELPSGALRVRVYAGQDPVTKKRHNLVEIIEPGPDQLRRARAARDRLVAQVEERRNPRTSATIDRLLERYVDQLDVAPNTLELYRGHIRRHISPFLGMLKVGVLDAEILDSFYAELRRCRKHCSGRSGVDHRTSRPHDCDERCRKHVCKPLSRSSVRHIHFILSGAYEKAVRWRWVAYSPMKQAEPPSASPSNPQPPSPAEAAQILNEAWRDPDWGSLLWIAMTTGMRRGELCALRWSAVNLDEGRESIWLRHAIRKENGGLVEAGLKTHQQRRIALDPETVAVLREQLERARNRSASLGLELESAAFVFSGAPDGSTFLVPDSVTQRYERLVRKLGIHTTIHKLRHYSATELIAAGVDVRTVAGWLGHSGGGVTTLRTYAAWVSEAGQRAAGGISARMPSRPEEPTPLERARLDPRSPL